MFFISLCSFDLLTSVFSFLPERLFLLNNFWYREHVSDDFSGSVFKCLFLKDSSDGCGTPEWSCFIWGHSSVSSQGFGLHCFLGESTVHLTEKLACAKFLELHLIT